MSFSNISLDTPKSERRGGGVVRRDGQGANPLPPSLSISAKGEDSVTDYALLYKDRNNKTNWHLYTELKPILRTCTSLAFTTSSE